MTITAMFSDHSVIFYDEKFNSYEANDTNPGYAEIIVELKKADADIDRLIALTKPVTAVKNAVAAAVAADYLPAGKVSVSLNEIRYDGEVVEGVLVDRILWMLTEGFDIMPMVRFLENLYVNPGTWTRDEFYLWLENSKLPITSDGHFLAYKRVRDDFTSIHDSTTKNDPGTVVSMPREEVDSVRAHECSTGLHFCSLSYLTDGPGAFGVGYVDSSGSKIVVLKINPADVVAIPGDYGNTKGRAWKYEVLSVVDSDPTTKVWASVVDAEGGDYSNPDFDDENDEDDDEFGDDDCSNLRFPSELASALFAAYGEIADDPKDRQARLGWASTILYGGPGWILSFDELSQGEAQTLIEAAREVKAGCDEQTEASARQAQIDAINSYGIVKLRKLTHKWTGYSVKELRAILIAAL